MSPAVFGRWGLSPGCAAKAWATAPPLKTVVLIGSIVSGARKRQASRLAASRSGRLILAAIEENYWCGRLIAPPVLPFDPKALVSDRTKSEPEWECHAFTGTKPGKWPRRVELPRYLVVAPGESPL